MENGFATLRLNPTPKKNAKKNKTKTNKQTKNKQQQQETNKKQTKKWGTGAVQDKPFDELLMFIVGKDSALFSGL